MEIRFTVWQFVRLMVHLEEHAQTDPAQTILQQAWDEIWQPLDQELSELAERDFDAYSELMMDQEIIIEDATPALIQTAQDVIDKVIADMDKMIETGGDPAHLQNLKFERRELRQLSRKLGRQTNTDEKKNT